MAGDPFQDMRNAVIEMQSLERAARSQHVQDFLMSMAMHCAAGRDQEMVAPRCLQQRSGKVGDAAVMRQLETDGRVNRLQMGQRFQQGGRKCIRPEQERMVAVGRQETDAASVWDGGVQRTAATRFQGRWAAAQPFLSLVLEAWILGLFLGQLSHDLRPFILCH